MRARTDKTRRLCWVIAAALVVAACYAALAVAHSGKFKTNVSASATPDRTLFQGQLTGSKAMRAANCRKRRLVSIYDSSGALYGSNLTDTAGRFTVQGDPDKSRIPPGTYRAVAKRVKKEDPGHSHVCKRGTISFQVSP